MIAADLLQPQKEIYNFLRTISISFKPFADLVNDTVIAAGYSVSTEKTTWKYYMNLVGEYHAYDTKMYVTSIETRQEILFSPAVLATNPRTAEAYSPGGEYYNKLCETYPNQVDLIKSILFPVPDLNAAINADDFTLLSYGKGYLEEWEQPFIIMEIERFLGIWVERYYADFLDDEPYFHLTSWGSLITHLALLIMTLRLDYINTPQVHSWHIWNKLQAYGVSNYSDILNREKSMLLYQNIEYLIANVGKQSNLVILADGLLSDIGIGLYGRRVVQECETLASTYQLNPQLVPVRVPTDYAVLAASIATEDVATVQAQIFEKGLTSSDSAEKVADVERALSNTRLNNYMTKFLELRPIARMIPYANMLGGFVIETMIVSIAQGYWTNAMTVIEPLTGSPIYMTPGELLALYNYALVQSLGLENDLIPTEFSLSRAFLPELGTPGTSFPVGPDTVLVSSEINVTGFLENLSYSTNIDSPETFGTMVTALWLRYMDHYLIDAKTSSDNRRQVLAYLTKFTNYNKKISTTLVPGYTSYSQWLGASGIDLLSTSLGKYASQTDQSSAWQNLASTIMGTLVPNNTTLSLFGNTTLSDAGYARLRDLFIQLCSYRVVFLDSTRDMPEDIVGPKLSNGLGKVTMSSITDIVYTLDESYTNSVRSALDTSIYPCVTIMSENVAHNKSNYTLTNVTELVSTTVHAQAARSNLMSSSTSTDTSTSAVSLPRSKLNAFVVDL